MQYGVIGETLKHSFSKEIHSFLADYEYEICELKKEELPAFFSKREFRAINVTIPYKKEVIPYLDCISETARKLESVNTIVNRGGKLFGYNTDYYGLKMLISRNGTDIEGKKVLILGTGGTARTAHLVACDMGACEVLLVSRKRNGDAIDYEQAKTLHSDADVIINATPCGMYPNNYNSPIDISCFPKLCGVVDAIFNPLRSELVLDARERNIPSEGGLYMLVAQAVYAVEYFLNTEIPKERITEIFGKVNAQKENIVLTGMPCSGKSTVGKILSDITGKEFYDTDIEVEKKIGKSISEYFAEAGEAEFRRIESETVKEISKKTGVIIATGGGAVLDRENVRALRSNGKLYFLDRSLNLLLPTDDRPLSRSADDMKKLFEKRYPIYMSVKDVRINGDGDASAVAEEIKKDFYKNENFDS